MKENPLAKGLPELLVIQLEPLLKNSAPAPSEDK
jgi:hypothetical protein